MIKYYYIRSKPAVSKKAEVTYTPGKRIETRDIQPRGAPIACVVYQRRRDDDMSPPAVEGETLEQTRAKSWDLVTYALSACNSTHDEFNKVDGRKLSYKRLTGLELETKPKKNSKRDETKSKKAETDSKLDYAYCFNIESTASANEVIEMILDELDHNTNVPSHVRRACKNWLDG
jgi:hypothetical protein